MSGRLGRITARASLCESDSGAAQMSECGSGRIVARDDDSISVRERTIIRKAKLFERVQFSAFSRTNPELSETAHNLLRASSRAMLIVEAPPGGSGLPTTSDEKLAASLNSSLSGAAFSWMGATA